MRVSQVRLLSRARVRNERLMAQREERAAGKRRTTPAVEREYWTESGRFDSCERPGCGTPATKGSMMAGSNPARCTWKERATANAGRVAPGRRGSPPRWETRQAGSFGEEYPGIAIRDAASHRGAGKPATPLHTMVSVAQWQSADERAPVRSRPGTPGAASSMEEHPTLNRGVSGFEPRAAYREQQRAGGPCGPSRGEHRRPFQRDGGVTPGRALESGSSIPGDVYPRRA